MTASQTPSMPRTMGRKMRASSWNSDQEGDERTGHAVAQSSEEGQAVDVETHEEEVQGVDAEGVGRSASSSAS